MPSRSIGEPLLGVVRIPVLNDLIAEIAGGADMAEAEIMLPGRTEKHFQTHAAALKDESGERIGIVFVFNDISKLKRLEQKRVRCQCVTRTKNTDYGHHGVYRDTP